MEFRLLGPLEVVERARVLELGGARQRALRRLAARFGWPLTAGAR